MSDLASFIQAIPGLASKTARSRILLVAYALRHDGVLEFNHDEIRAAFQRARLPKIEGLDTALPDLCIGRNAPLVDTPDGKFALSIDGVSEVEQYLETVAGIKPAKEALVHLAGKISDAAERRFLLEAIRCIQAGAPRAAMVMAWALTIDHLQNYVLQHKLAEFNKALSARSDALKNVTIAIKDDFEKIAREVVLIEVLRSASVVTNDVRKILDGQLGFRNTCGHPANVEVPEGKVVAAIEDLVHNVVLKYAI